MSIVEAGLSRPPVRLNTYERVHNDPDLRCVYTGETGFPSFYHLVPVNQAPRLGGAMVKSVYAKNSNLPGRAKVTSLWIGKMGTPKSFERLATTGDSRSWGAYNEGDMNEEVVKEKIGSDAYRLFGDGFFATPKTRLSMQPIRDQYTQDNELVKAYSNPTAYLPSSFGSRPLTQSLRFMSKFIQGYCDFEKILVPNPESPTESLPFMQYIKTYGRPPEKILDPASNRELPIYGVMAVLAAATSLGDVDVLGGGGKNCGLIFLRSTEEIVYGALVVKIDPGFVFSYQPEAEAGRKQRKSPKDIRYAPSELLYWERLTKDQKDEFLEVKRNALILKDSKILEYLFQREGNFRQEGIPISNHFDQMIQQYKSQLEAHLVNEVALYADDLTEYEGRRDHLIDVKGREFFEKGEYDRAFNYLEKRVEILVSKIDDPAQILDLSFWSEFSNAHINLGAVYHSIGKYDEAIDVFERGLHPQVALEEVRNRNPFVAHLFRSLGLAYYAREERAKALEFYKRALEIQITIFGEKHLEVANTYNNIAVVHDAEQKHDLAIEFGEKALKIRCQNLGDDNSLIANSLHNLGQYYNNKGMFDKALEYLGKAYQIRTSILRANHPEIGLSYSGLAKIYSNQGKHREAIQFQENAILIAVAAFGQKHLQVADRYHELANMHFAQKNYNQTIEALRKALSIQLDALGENHKSIIQTYSSFVKVYGSIGKQELVIQFIEKILCIKKNIFGENHPDVADTLNDLGATWHNLGNYQRAIESLKKALEIRLSKLDPNDPKIALSYNQLGVTYNAKGEHDQAAECCQNALRINRTNYEEDHLATAMSYNGLGKAHVGQDRPEQAIEALEKALRIRIALMGENNFDIASTCGNLGSAYYKLKKYDQAIDSFERANRILMAIEGDNRLFLSRNYSSMGAIYYADNTFDKAIASYQKALDIDCVIFGENDPHIFQSYNNLATVYHSMGDYNQEIICREKQLQMTRITLGANHPMALRISIEIGRMKQNIRGEQPTQERQGLPPKDDLLKLLNFFERSDAASAAHTGESAEDELPMDALAFVLDLVEGGRRSFNQEESDDETPVAKHLPFVSATRGMRNRSAQDDDNETVDRTHQLEWEILRRLGRPSKAKVEEIEDEPISVGFREKAAASATTQNENVSVPQALAFLIRQCQEYYLSKQGDKVQAVIDLRVKLEEVLKGDASIASVIQHVNSELNLVNNPIFEASRLRGSVVQKIFQDSHKGLLAVQQLGNKANLKSQLEPLIEACRVYYAQKLGIKVGTVTALKQLLENLAVGKTSQKEVLSHVSSELNRKNNPLFEASWFRKSDLQKIYEQSLEYLQSIEKANH